MDDWDLVNGTGLSAIQAEVIDVDGLEENQIPLDSSQNDAVFDFDDFSNGASDAIPSHESDLHIEDEQFAFIPKQNSNPDPVVESAIVDNDFVDLEPDPQIYQQALASSLVSSIDSGVPKFPWETGVMSAIFSTDPLVDMFPKMPQLSADSVPGPIPGNPSRPDPQQRKRVFEAAFIPGVSSRVSQRRRDMGYQIQREKLLQKATNKWATLLQEIGNSSHLFRSIVREGKGAYDFEVASKALQAAFGVKSPGTLNKRADSMIHFSNWHRTAYGGGAFPLVEMDVWFYICHLEDTNSGKTKAAGFLQSLNFSRYVLDMDGVAESMSARVRGKASQVFAQKSEWRPAPLLTVQEVRLIHNFMDNLRNSLLERIFAAHVLFAIYSRSRWSDLRCVKQIIFDWGRDDRGYIEVLTVHHKSTRTSELKTKLLPVVAPTQGIVEGVWARTFQSLRAEGGLINEGEIQGALLPVPSGDSGWWHECPVSSQEITQFVQSILRRESTLQQPTSHSFKSTPLSWCSKYGIDDPDRRVLGRHADRVRGTDALYAREILARPLRRFKTVLHNIKTGNFCPDETRSGMFDGMDEHEAGIALATSGAMQVSAKDMSLERQHDERAEIQKEETKEELLRRQEIDEGDESGQIETNDPPAVSRTGSSSSISLSSSSDSCESEESVEQDDRLFHLPSGLQQIRMQHTSSGVIHRVAESDESDSQRFACGRGPTQKHFLIRGQSPRGARRCAGCYPDIPRLKSVEQVCDMMDERAKARKREGAS